MKANKCDKHRTHREILTSTQADQDLTPIHRPELKEKIFFLVSGIIISVPLTLFIGSFTDSLCVILPIFYATLCTTSIFTPFIEEFAKAYPLFYRHGETERSIFLLGFLVGLGFGFAEFLVFVLGLGVPIFVRLPGILFHAASASITAYGIVKKQSAQFYLIAVGLHFSNNIAALFNPLWLIVGPTTIAVTYFISWVLYRKTSEALVA